MAVTLIIQNNLSIPRSYLGGLISLGANSAYTATQQYVYPLCRDPILVLDCSMGNVFLSDGINIYNSPNVMLAYLNQIASGLGGAVVGYGGSPAPSFQITVGGKDSNGNSQPARMNQFSDLATNYRNNYKNISGNSTTTVKSSSGTLHGIMINNNSTGGTITIYDNTSASGTIIATITIGSPTGGLLSSNGQPSPALLGPLGLEFQTGLTIVTAGSSSNNITALYQ